MFDGWMVFVDEVAAIVWQYIVRQYKVAKAVWGLRYAPICRGAAERAVIPSSPTQEPSHDENACSLLFDLAIWRGGPRR
jgi:hypothetical protein